MRSTGSDAVLIASHSIRIMVQMLQQAGIDAGGLLESLGLTLAQIEDPDCAITIRQELAFQRKYAELTKDIPGFWYRTGLRYGVLSYGSLGLASLSTDVVGEALTLFVTSFQDLNYSLLHYRFAYKDGQPVAIETSDEDVPPDLWLFSQERSLGSVMRLTSDFAPQFRAIARIESALPASRSWLSGPELDGVPISFGHSRSRWYLVPDLVQRKLPLANDVLEITYRRLCEKMVERMSAQAGLVSRVYMLLLSGQAEPMTIAGVAAELCLHERTLQRKLAEAGFTFSDLVAQVREQRAKSMLRSPTLTIGQIADQMGFSEAASFSHAFKRWTGETPIEFRKTQRNGAD